METVDLCIFDTGWLPSCHIRSSCTRMPKVRIAIVAHSGNRTAGTEIKTFKTFKRLRVLTYDRHQCKMEKNNNGIIASEQQ